LGPVWAEGIPVVAGKFTPETPLAQKGAALLQFVWAEA